MRKTVEVQMDAGMEARPIALMVQTANQLSGDGRETCQCKKHHGNDEPCSDKRSGCHDRCGRNRRSGSSGSIRETFDRQINVE